MHLELLSDRSATARMWTICVTAAHTPRTGHTPHRRLRGALLLPPPCGTASGPPVRRDTASSRPALHAGADRPRT
eukprot:COSAG01_NODE_1551_length_9933_cov_19.737848_12_plen_75_part_00